MSNDISSPIPISTYTGSLAGTSKPQSNKTDGVGNNDEFEKIKQEYFARLKAPHKPREYTKPQGPFIVDNIEIEGNTKKLNPEKGMLVDCELGKRDQMTRALIKFHTNSSKYFQTQENKINKLMT